MKPELDDFISDLAASARPAVRSQERTTLDMTPYRNPDSSAPLAPDVDGLFGATKGYTKYKHEKPEHRLMLWYRLQGYNVKETAQLTGYTPQTISNISKQPWFQSAFIELAAAQGKDAITSFLEGEVMPALERVVSLAQNGDSDNVRLAANRELLDRFLGKSTVKIESKGSVDINHTVLDANRLMQEQRQLDEQLKANGLLHGRS